MTWNNLTYLDGSTGLAVVIEGVNNNSGGWFIGGLMIVLFIVLMIVFYGRVGFGEILIASGFLLSIVGLIFILMGLLPTFVIGITISLIIFGLLTVFMGGN